MPFSPMPTGRHGFKSGLSRLHGVWRMEILFGAVLLAEALEMGMEYEIGEEEGQNTAEEQP